MPTIFHIAPHGSDTADGSTAHPFRTISRGAQAAQPGDTVLVHAGEYREWVAPPRGGLSDRRRITYAAAPGETPVIKGSERVTGWTLVAGTVWKSVVQNAAFGDFNPFAEEIAGDWLVYPDTSSRSKHLADVYLNGRSFYEAESLDEIADPAIRTVAVDHWTGSEVAVRDPDQTRFLWYGEVDEEHTTIWANFHGADPNTELVEINVRRSVFFPTERHINYVTVRGFELAHAASPWAPPTADQPGLIGPNWAKGWIIEDNVIHDAKCSAISIGKEKTTGHNFAMERGDKPGYQYQLESVFAAVQVGWDREHVGSHIIRRNTIFDCGQNGIVGHLGCVFSTIEDNHIYNIAIKREFYGHEIGGIKLHAAIDVTIRHNRIHDCSLGIWLDWQTQGTRVTRNLLYDNARDLFIEVSHGPYIVDHNAFGSRASLEVFSQGGAFANNLVAGTVSIEPVVDRPTPYHVPHSTQVAGYAAILGGDDRFIGNIFLDGDADLAYGPTARAGQIIGYGTAGYDAHPDSFDEYLIRTGDSSLGDHERFSHVKQPVYMRGNVYSLGAQSYGGETSAIRLTDPGVRIAIVADGDSVFLDAQLPPEFDDRLSRVVTQADLPAVRFVGADFEHPDGTPVVLDVDLVGDLKHANESYAAGPLGSLRSGTSRTRVW